jgi:hypothetical protein
VLDWYRSNPVLFHWMFALSAIMFVAGLLGVPFLVSRMRADHFLHPEPPSDSWRGQHPALRVSALVIKNVLGVVLLAAGIAMLVLPGQGIITILVGLSLLNFPGKRRLELRIVSQRPVLHAINWIRARAAQAPLRLPERD